MKDRGVSPIIGFILIFMILVSSYAVIQSYVVPIWNQEAEIKHLDVVYNDMMKIKADIGDVALKKIPKTVDIHLGLRYPNRIIFSNLVEGAAGTLYFDNVNITVEYTLNTSSMPKFVKRFTSSRIIYELHGSILSPKYVYEHGIIIRDWGTVNLSTDQQTLIIGDEIYIPVVTAEEISKSSMEVESLDIYPYTQEVIKTNVKYVNITIETNYPDVWQDLLSNLNTSHTTVYVHDNKIIINSTAIRSIVFPSGDTSGDMTVGIIKLSTSIIPPLPSVPPGYTNIDTSKPNWPSIVDICIKSIDKTKSQITAIVKNVTAPYDIHADLTDITKNPELYDVQPDWSYPDDINADNWSLPNINLVNWSNIVHPEYDVGQGVIVTFWVVNTENGMQFYTSRVFIRQSKAHWFGECEAELPTITLYPIKDAYVDQDKPNKNYGSKHELHVQSFKLIKSKNKRTFIQFDLSSIPKNARILSAKLRLYLYDPPISSRTYEIYRVCESWEENKINWNNQPSVAENPTSTTTIPTTKGWVEWDVTSDVQAMVNGSVDNYGWMIKDKNEDSLIKQESKFYSRERPSKKPELIIMYI